MTNPEETGIMPGSDAWKELDYLYPRRPVVPHYITLHYISGGFRGGPRSGSLYRPYRASLRCPDRQVTFIAPLIEDHQSGT